jgi:hypothetical protein
VTGTVLDIVNLRFDNPTHLIVEAVIEDAAVVRRQTSLEPAEYGPALCQGTLYFDDEQRIPATDADFMTMLSNEVDDWRVLDTTDAVEAQ